MNMCILCTSFDYYHHIYLKLYSALNANSFSPLLIITEIILILMTKLLYVIPVTHVKRLLLHAL